MTYQGNDVRLGQIIGTDRELVMSAADRHTHLLIPGNTGVGKSKMMESMVCQDIDAYMESGCGLMLIDPHGSVYRNVLKYVVESGLDRPIIPLDFSRDDWILGYNPLRHSAEADPSVIISDLIGAISHVFGLHDIQTTLRFSRVASAILLALLRQDRPFLEAFQLASNPAAMKILATLIPDATAKSVLSRAAEKSDRDFEADVESTMNRFLPFSENKRFKAMFGHVGAAIDLREVLDKGAILLVNLETTHNRLSPFQAKLFGTLLLTDLWSAARDRGKPDDAADINPFYVYIDECQNFVTPTIAENLAQARGYGLNLILANQYPSQFLAFHGIGQAMYDATMAAARSKAVFQISHLDDLESLTKQLFSGVLDPTKVKRFTRKVVGYEVGILRSHTSGTNRQDGDSDGTHEGRSTGKSQRQERFGELDDPDIYESEQYVDGLSATRSSITGESESDTEAETLMPIMGDEVAEYFSLDEQLAIFQQVLNGQDKREGIVRLVSMKAPVAIRTLEVPPPWVSDEAVEAYLQRRFSSLDYALPLVDAIATALKREDGFLQSVMELADIAEPAGGRKVRRARQLMD